MDGRTPCWIDGVMTILARVDYITKWKCVFSNGMTAYKNGHYDFPQHEVYYVLGEMKGDDPIIIDIIEKDGEILEK